MNGPDDLGDLREFLAFAVPLRSIELAHQYTQADLADLLPGMVVRGGLSLGHGGDALQFAGSDRKIVRRTANDLVSGVAAAAMLAGPDGLTFLGVEFAPARRRFAPQPSSPAPASTPGITDLPDLAGWEETA